MQKNLTINFVGLFNQPGYVGELSDETHIARELEKLGHTVNRVQRDIWKAYVDGDYDPSWDLPIKADINLIAKWHHFDKPEYIQRLKEVSRAGMPSSNTEGAVFYWIWDYMPNPDIPGWHRAMAIEADLYLSGEAGIFDQYRAFGARPYYFQMDVCDGDIPTFNNLEKVYDVVFTGSYLGQGHRVEWLKKINEQIPVTIFSWNPEEWIEAGFEQVYPAVYGEEYNKVISQSKIVVGFSVEPNCWGYWSNRVGKVLRAGGFLLQEYAPGMEIQLPYCVQYFNSPDEAIGKIKAFLEPKSPSKFHNHEEFTSKYKIRKLAILMERYLEGDPTKWLL